MNPTTGNPEAPPPRDHLHSYARVEKALRWAAAVVLVSGLISSVLIWRAQDRLERQRRGSRAAEVEAQVSPLENRKQLWQMEYYGGKGVVFLEEVKGWFHGKPLARTVAIASVITAAGLFLVTVRRSE
jgi:hypothetical protein